MIIEFKLEAVATYKNTVVVSDLKKLNFFYGTNGCGKTTISRLLANSNDIIFSKSYVINELGYTTYVYNQDFIDKKFHSNDHLNGIFTLGDDAKEAELQISRIKQEIESISKDIEEGKKLFDGKSDQCLVNYQKLQKNQMVNDVWEFKKELEKKSELVKNLFEGFNNSKENFFNELILRYNQKNAKSIVFDEIIKKASILYGEEQSLKEEITKISLENYSGLGVIPELSEVIVNSTTNSQLSDLIKRLNHFAWFEKGIGYLNNNDGSCPFCNTKFDFDFMQSVNQSIDQSYKNKKQIIERYLENYNLISGNLVKFMLSIVEILAKEIDVVNTRKNLEIIELRSKENLKKIQSKLANLNAIITLEKFADLIQEINSDIDKYNTLVKDHNQLIQNRKKEENVLKHNLWDFAILALSNQIQTYQHNFSKSSVKIQEIKKQVEEKQVLIKQLNIDKAQWAEKASVTEATCIAINKLLADFGFTSFRLDLIDDSGHYQIVREDGSRAKNTLSEGEKTFITFLYFYHLIKGGDTTDNISSDKIVVIDDPISSLDSDVLFIVSTLIKGLYKGISDGNTYLKQLILLTHNIHFFMELTKLTYGWFTKNTNYYLVRKHAGISNINYKSVNPIRSSYESLWSELQYFRDNNLTGIQNCMRRILENYFTHWGYAKDLDKLIDTFIGTERLVFKSLINWMHNGSHQIIDSFYVSDLEHETEIYLDIFKRIFEETNQIGHYNMMMRIEEVELG